MSIRRPVDPRYTGRTPGALPRSPAERLEPTRPLSRSSRGRRPARFSREPGRSSGFVRVVSGIFTLLVVCMALLGAGALLLQSWVTAPGPLRGGKAVVIPRGEGIHEIAARLEREGAVTDRRLFIAAYFMARVTGDSSRPIQLKAGDYQIPREASVRNIIDILSEGKTILHRVSVPEGLTSHQIVERLKADPNLVGEIAEVPPEGVLLPDTFSVQRGEQRQTIIDNMRAQSRKLMDKVWVQRQKDLPFKTWEEAMVLASIVEKETGRNDERERVAAVFVNRLRQKMRLQSDPTILYGISTGKTVWNRPIMRSEIAQKTAHNTYQIDGLPPTPICNPGRAAIEAVLNPASSKDLYFVADGNGGHIFSETLKDHNTSVQKWRALEREARDKEKEKDAKAEKDSKAEKDGKGEATGKGKAAAPSPSPVPPAKTPERAPDKSKGTTAVTGAPAASKAGAPQDDNAAWSSTTEPAQAKAKR
jgi:UPF0755 protein